MRSRLSLTILAAACWASLGNAAEAPEIRDVKLLISGPSIADPFSRPVSLAADSTRGIVVVADTGRQRLVLFDAGGRSRGTMACQTSGREGEIAEPRGVAMDARGRLYVLDGMRREIEVRSATGARLALLDPAASIAAASRPQNLAVGRSGRLYLVYAGAVAGLLVTEPRGPVVLQVGFEPDGVLHAPIAVAPNADESLIAVVDPEAERVVLVFAADGTLRNAFGKHGEGDGTFSMATHVTWGPQNTLWVTDTIRHSISVFEADGNYRGRIGGFGHGPGEFDYPAACAFLAADRLVVLERAGARLQVLEVDAGAAWEPRTGLGSPGSGSTGTLSSAEVR